MKSSTTKSAGGPSVKPLEVNLRYIENGGSNSVSENEPSVLKERILFNLII